MNKTGSRLIINRLPEYICYLNLKYEKEALIEREKILIRG